MKKLVLALLVAAPLAASAKTVTVEVCDGGESGTECRMVTYKVRPASAPVVEACVIGGGGEAARPCPTVYGVPQWLKDLSAWFEKQGAVQVEEDIYKGG